MIVLNFIKYKKIGLLFIALALFMLSGNAQVRFTLNAPAQVAEGSQFRISFSVNAQGSNIRMPSFSGFSVISGPNQSQSSSTQIINGQTSNSMEISFSYILEAGKIGKYTIGQASIQVNGQTYKTTAHNIEVVKGNPKQTQARGNQQQQQQQATISANDLFLRAIPSKSAAYQGEEVLILYKLYFTIPIVQYGMSKLPSSTGFWSNELTDKKLAPRQYSESYNGKNYNVADLRKIAVYPQKSGKLTINPLNMDLIAQLRQQRQQRNFWDNFFSDPFSVQNVKKELNSNSVNIQVLPYPEPKPEGFNNAVGNYTVTCNIDKTKAKTNDAISISLTVSGKGNLRLLDPPAFEFPSDFEVYDPKINDKIVTSLSGISGSRTFEYLIIPRNPGKFTIKSIDFVSFNPTTKSYNSYKTPTFNLEIEKGNGYSATTASNMANQKDIKYLGSDIRFIKKDNYNLSNKDSVFYFSLNYFLILLSVFVIFVALIIYFRKQITMRKDLVLMRNKRASKLAHKRLSKAQGFMKSMKKDEFFIEISQVIWGFVADKCNIPLSQLSMETIRIELEKINTDSATINDFELLLNDCEFARFTPGDPIDLMHQFYDRAFNAIITLEKSMKNLIA
jgi:hypothetical protein